MRAAYTESQSNLVKEPSSDRDFSCVSRARTRTSRDQWRKLKHIAWSPPDRSHCILDILSVISNRLRVHRLIDDPITRWLNRQPFLYRAMKGSTERQFDISLGRSVWLHFFPNRREDLYRYFLAFSTICTSSPILCSTKCYIALTLNNLFTMVFLNDMSKVFLKEVQELRIERREQNWMCFCNLFVNKNLFKNI